MPIYEYECRKCKAHIEVFNKMTDKPPVKCRKCGGRLEKMLSAPAIHFKGSGWYVTDYARSNKKAEAKSDSEPASDAQKSEKKSKETSPAKSNPKEASSPKVPSGD